MKNENVTSNLHEVTFSWPRVRSYRLHNNLFVCLSVHLFGSCPLHYASLILHSISTHVVNKRRYNALQLDI